MNLIHLSQIKDGQKLKAAIEALQTSDAAKALLTDVYKIDGDTKTPLYRKTADAIAMSDLDTSLQEVIKTAATPDVFDPTDILKSIDNLTKTKISANDLVAAANDSASYAPSEAKPISEKATYNLIDTRKHFAHDSIAVTAEAGSPVTTFQLTVPAGVQFFGKIQMTINHCVYYQDEDFTLNTTNNQITWTLTKANKGFDIDKDLTDKVTFDYVWSYKTA